MNSNEPLSVEAISVQELLPRLLSSFDVTGNGELLTFSVAGRMQKRARSASVLKYVEAAKARKGVTGQPFWDSLFMEVERASDQDIAEVMHLASFHQRMLDAATSRLFPLTQEGLAGQLSESMHPASPNAIVALSSRLRLDNGKECHIPMLDYRIPASSNNLRLVIEQLRAMRVSGWVLNSGRSYHFLGDRLLHGRDEWRSWLGCALLFAPLVDGRWVAHQLVEGACALRISAGDAKQPPPRVLAHVD